MKKENSIEPGKWYMVYQNKLYQLAKNKEINDAKQKPDKEKIS